MLPIHALSMRTCATMFPPSSATAMFMGWPISLAFFSAALIMRRASSNFTAVMVLLLLCVIRPRKIGEVGRTDRYAVPTLSPTSSHLWCSQLSQRLARLSLRLLSDEKALARDWREQ